MWVKEKAPRNGVPKLEVVVTWTNQWEDLPTRSVPNNLSPNLVFQDHSSDGPNQESEYLS